MLVSVSLVILVMVIFERTGFSQADDQLVKLDDKQAHEGDASLEDLCNLKHTPLHTLVDFEVLIAALDRQNVKCCTKITEDAMRALALITRDTTDACTQTKADAIANFSEQYLQNKELPLVLHRFAVAYGMRVSRICRSHMMMEWFEAAEEATLDYHFSELSRWTHESAPISRLLEPLLEKNDFILPADLWAALPDDLLRQKVLLIATKGGHINRAIDVCSERFRPLYEPIVMPLATLSRAGFNHKGLALKEGENLFSVRMSLIKDWSKVVFVCEILKRVERVEGEVDSRRHRLDEEDYAARREGKRFSLEKTEPYVANEMVPNEIFVVKDLSFLAAVLSYDPNKSPNKALQGKLLKRNWKLLVVNKRAYGHFRDLLNVVYKFGSAKLAKKVDEREKTEEKLRYINEHLIKVLQAKDKSSLYVFLSRLFRFGTKLVRGLMHFVVTAVFYSMWFVLFYCSPDRVGREIKTKLDKFVTILQE